MTGPGLHSLAFSVTLLPPNTAPLPPILAHIFVSMKWVTPRFKSKILYQYIGCILSTCICWFLPFPFSQSLSINHLFLLCSRYPGHPGPHSQLQGPEPLVSIHSDWHCGHQNEGECVGADGRWEPDSGAVWSFHSEFYKWSLAPPEGPRAPCSPAGMLFPQAEE